MVTLEENEVTVMRTKEAIQFRIMEICHQEQLTLNALCCKCGITQSTLNNIVCGRNNSATVATIKKICDGIGMELPEFFACDAFCNLEQEIR